MTIDENRKLLAIVLAAVVVIVSGVGLYLAGSPAEARLLRLDDRRVDDLRSISWSLLEYRRGRGRLPPTLDSLPIALGDAPRLHDPVTERPYSYEVTGDSSYTLCTDFARPSPGAQDGGYDTAWRHPAGHFCFPKIATATP